MKPLLRALALGVGPVVVVGGLGVLGQAVPSIPQVPPPPSLAAACTQPPVFKTGYQRESNGVLTVGQGFKFNGLAWIQTIFCSAGTLTITASGEVAGGEQPQLTVMRDDAILGIFSFDLQKTVQVQVPGAGKVYLAYLNDYYLADARLATLSRLDVIGTTCQGLKSVSVPAATGGSWNADTGSVSLVSSVAMTVVPCGAGQFTVEAVGRQGNKTFPQLSFRQNGQIIESSVLKKNPTIIRINITAAPLSIILTNPYFKELADRNLNIQRIDFIPRSN